ncbi:MAG: flavin reductase [Tannerellaceae bacterium]|jgi:flavin reductase (DIM6/NTAB) family NADH-FMN oxidoreductase RutF|nr:flavin reductase [Tannerellaceae bacterium]
MNHIYQNESNFKQLFKPILPQEIQDSVFTLVGESFPVVTAGNKESYNSMTASGGGMGILLKKPVTLCLFPIKRYTLNLIKKEQKYTLSYFPDEYRKQVMFLGSKSGQDSDKMKEVALTTVELPSGNISFKEARLIIECKLMQITTPSIDDFYTQEAKDYLNEAYTNEDEIRQYVFGEIIRVWLKQS